MDYALVLPVDGHVSEDAGDFERGSITSLLPPDTLLVVPKNEHVPVNRVHGSQRALKPGLQFNP